MLVVLRVCKVVQKVCNPDTTMCPLPAPFQDSVWSDSAFYVWLYDRPTSIWTVVATVALPVVVIGACSFSLAPWWMRMTLVYSLMGLLTVLLGLLALRYVLFTMAWIVTGSSFWLFPNLTADEVREFCCELLVVDLSFTHVSLLWLAGLVVCGRLCVWEVGKDELQTC